MRNKGLIIGLSVVVAALVLGALYTAFSINNRPLSEAARKENPKEIVDNYEQSEVWGKYYPKHWESFNEGSKYETKTKYGGNNKTDKLKIQPYLKVLYKGTGYAEEFYEPRSHFYAVQDVGAINPKRTKTGGACLTCKGSEVPRLIKENGVDFYSKPFSEMYKLVNNPIGCANCHDPKTNDLRISQPPLLDYFKRTGQDITKVSKQEMRSLVCAQCHVTYYFKKDTKQTTFPWDDGLKPEEVLAYYERIKFTEWVHPDSKTPLLKARHPDYELFQGSVHQSAGVACADCHMPYTKVGDTKISSHWFTSPVHTVEKSCTKCHRESTEHLKDLVYKIQDQHHEILDIAGNAQVQAMNTITQVSKTTGADQKILDEARELHRQSQWMWDWVATANSMGFHNRQEAAVVLGKSIDLAHKAVQKAESARRTQ